MAKPYSDKKLNLGEPVASMLRDFSAANYNASALDIIREAVQEHIQRRLDEEPKLRDRYETARKRRLGIDEKVVKLIDKPD